MALQRIQEVSRIFAVELLAYAIHEDSIELVVAVLPELAAEWTCEQVADRWFELFPPTRRGHYVKGTELRGPRDTATERLLSDPCMISTCRERLSCLSWFMKSINEYIALQINRAEGKRGRFWEGRYRCVRLEDEQAILTAMLSVDLTMDPNQAVVAIEGIPCSSACERSLSVRSIRMESAKGNLPSPPAPVPAGGSDNQPATEGAPPPTKESAQLLEPLDRLHHGMNLRVTDAQYLELLDWVRQRLADPEATEERNAESHAGTEKPVPPVPPSLRPLVERITSVPQLWIRLVRDFRQVFRRMAGRVAQMVRAAADAGLKWFCGVRASAIVFEPTLARRLPG